MNSTYNMLVAVAERGDGWGTAGGGWVWWGPLIPLLWIAFFAIAFWFVSRRLRPRERSGVERATDILAERFARGELSTEEYRERLDQLRGV